MKLNIWENEFTGRAPVCFDQTEFAVGFSWVASFMVVSKVSNDAFYSTGRIIRIRNNWNPIETFVAFIHF